MDRVQLVRCVRRHLESSIAYDIFTVMENCQFSRCAEDQKTTILPRMQKEAFSLVYVSVVHFSSTKCCAQLVRQV